MLRYIGAALFGLFIVLILPIGSDTNLTDAKYYGAATIVAFDKMGNEFFQQVIHNRLVDTGEELIIGLTFSDGNFDPALVPAEDDQVGAICISDNEPTGRV